MKPTEPGAAMPAANVAFRPPTGFITPRQLGPMIRMPAFRASARTAASSAAPAGPISRNPAEMMITPLTPASAHSRTRPGADSAGVTMTARSTGSPVAARLG